MPLKEDIRRVKVVSYSGYKANERPLYFLIDNRKVEVERVVDRWYGEEHDYFKVVTEEGKVCLLKWHRRLDLWLLTR
jgi:hypothetical protein